MSTPTVEEIRSHLEALNNTFYPGGGGAPDPSICNAADLGLIFDALARTHQQCVTAANVVHCRRDQDYAAGGIRTAISQDLYSAGLELVSARWEMAVAAYVEAVAVVEAVRAARAEA